MSNKDVVIDADFTEVDQDGNVKDDVQQTVQNTEKKETLIGKIVGGARKNSKMFLGMAIGAGLVYGLTKMANRTGGVPASLTDIPASIPDQVVPNAATPDMESTINGIVDEIRNNTI